ncbi:MAG: DUF58 domain-containing protein [Planctomycetota bacterium]|nr:DUF58 domain-containing protein [Planctomycetota bacterium]
MLKTTAERPIERIDDLLPPALVAKMEALDLASRKIFYGKLIGERRSKKRGQSVEFADHRPYVVGDDLRRIDWNIFGRLDRLFLKLFQEEEDLGLHVVIDASASSGCGTPSKFRFMQEAAMALGYVGLVILNRVAATAMGYADGSVVASLRDLRGKRRVRDLFEFYRQLEPAGGFSFRQAAERIALSRRGKGVMLVFSDFFMKDGYEDGLRLLTGRGYDLIAVQVLSPQELEPDIAGDLRLKDVEDGDLAEVTISAPLLKRYKANLAAYTRQLQEFCARREITFLPLRSDTPVEVLILDYLRKRGVVK